MSVSALLKQRVRRPSYLKKLAKAEDLIDLFPHGSYVGWSGFTGVGYPKYVTPSTRVNFNFYSPGVHFPYTHFSMFNSHGRFCLCISSPLHIPTGERIP